MGRTPDDKGKVESGVHYMKRNFLAGRTFRDITEGSERLLSWVVQVAGQRIHGTIRQKPLEVFEGTEREELLPLPSSSYDMGTWKRLKLHRDCHIVLDSAYYSALHRRVGQTLWIRSNEEQVVIFHDYERVASHRWGFPGTRRTIDSHYPPHKVAVLRATPAACRERAAEIGPAAREIAGIYLDDRVVDRRHAARSLLRLGDRHGDKRLEATCRRGYDVLFLAVSKLLGQLRRPGRRQLREAAYQLRALQPLDPRRLRPPTAQAPGVRGPLRGHQRPA